jgi:hypothetical protein
VYSVKESDHRLAVPKTSGSLIFLRCEDSVDIPSSLLLLYGCIRLSGSGEVAKRDTYEQT